MNLQVEPIRSLKKTQEYKVSQKKSANCGIVLFFFYCVFNGEIHHLFTK